MDPFTEQPGADISALGEKSLIREIRAWLGDTAPPSPFGMGDDCAVLPEDGPPARLVTTDSVVLGRHFEALSPPVLVGAKLLNRNLSDIAAMGGTPTHAVLAGMLPRRLATAWLREFCMGLAAAARAHGVLIVGGDLTETRSELAFNLTLLGTAERVLTRHGGQPGDWICVTGQLGGSLLGRHLAFAPRLDEGRALAARADVHACIDLSDGLLIDLAAIVPDGASARLRAGAVPVHPDAQRAGSAERPALWHALNDGEDHELLFLMAPPAAGAWERLQADFAARGLAPLSCIGVVTTNCGAPVVDDATGQPFSGSAGYDHFR